MKVYPYFYLFLSLNIKKAMLCRENLYFLPSLFVCVSDKSLKRFRDFLFLKVTQPQFCMGYLLLLPIIKRNSSES